MTTIIYSQCGYGNNISSMLVADGMNFVRERFPCLSSFFHRSRCGQKKSQGSGLHSQNKAATIYPRVRQDNSWAAIPTSLNKEEPRVGEAKSYFHSSVSRNSGREEIMGKSETVRNAEKLVETAMKGNDASHDAAHAFRVRDLALSLAREEGLSSSPDSMEIVELAALLHDIGDYKYVRDPSEENMIEDFLEAERVEESKRIKILSIIKGMGFKEELSGHADNRNSLEFGVVQDADRLDAIGAIGIARCFTFGGSRNNVLYDPSILPRSDLVKGQYMEKNKQTTVNHFHEKLLKLKDLMKTKAGRRRAEKRHKFMENFLKEFFEEWDGRS